MLPNFYQAVSQNIVFESKKSKRVKQMELDGSKLNEIRDSLYASPINGRFGINANDY